MLFEVEKIIDDVLGVDVDTPHYPRQFIKDVLLEYIGNSESSEESMRFAFKPISEYISILRLSALMAKAKDMKENRANPNRITAHDSITDAKVIFDGLVSEVGGYTLFITPHHKLYDLMKDDPKKLIGRIFLETFENGIDVQYLKVTACVPRWIKSKSQRQSFQNLEYRTVKFARIKMPLLAYKYIQQYREQHGE